MSENSISPAQESGAMSTVSRIMSATSHALSLPEILIVIFTQGVESFDPPDYANNYLYFEPLEYAPISRYLDLYNPAGARRTFLRALTLTCRLWMETAIKTPQLWRYIDTNMHRKQFDTWIQRCGENQDIEIRHRCGYGCENNWQDQIGEKIHSRKEAGTLPPVRSLLVHHWGPGLPVGGPQFEGERDVPCSFTLLDCPNTALTHLTLHKNGYWWRFEQLQLLLCCSPNLVSLRITEQLFAHCIEPSRPRIPLVKLKHLVFVDVECGHQIMQSLHLPSLEHLLLAIDPSEGQQLGRTLEDLGESATQLKDLHIVSSTGSAEEEMSVRQFISGQRHLEKLSLSFFSRGMISALANTLLPGSHAEPFPCPNLTTVAVSFTPCDSRDLVRLLRARNFPSGPQGFLQRCRPVLSISLDHCNVDDWAGDECEETRSVTPAFLPSKWRKTYHANEYPPPLDRIQLGNEEAVQPTPGATIYMVPGTVSTSISHPAVVQILNGPLPSYALDPVLDAEKRMGRQITTHLWTTWHYVGEEPSDERPISPERLAIFRLLMSSGKTLKELGITPYDIDYDENYYTKENPNPFRSK